LALHRNITKTQQSLFSALETSLVDAWEVIALRKELTGMWRKTLNDLLGDLKSAKEDVRRIFKYAEMEASRMTKHFTNQMGTAMQAFKEKGQIVVEDLEEVSFPNILSIIHKISPDVRKTVHPTCQG
jgi:hypothetical protein